MNESQERIQGSCPVYQPPNAVSSEKLIQDAHVLTLRGRVGLSMTYIRRDYWIPRLRRLTKKVICGCFGCKRSQAAAFRNPPPGNLQLNAPPVQFPSKSWMWTMPVQFHTRPVPREKRETPTSCCLHVVWPEPCNLSFWVIKWQRGLSRVSSDSKQEGGGSKRCILTMVEVS